MIFALLLAAAVALTPQLVENTLAGHSGAYVQIDCATGKTFQSNAEACAEKRAPCSTFKIWNSAIGLETGVIASQDAPFWKWDGVKRTVAPGWNQDQTLRTAFAASCVPAYQNLARKIGAERMRTWIDRIGYGDRDISAGLDVFWLPTEGRRTVFISADEQAELVCKLVDGRLPFSKPTLAALKDVMKVSVTDRGTLYGKTGSGTDKHGQFGWFVGYVESSGKTFAFACRRDGGMGKEARTVVETLLSAQGLL